MIVGKVSNDWAGKENEPEELLRFWYDGHAYLIGIGIQESAGVRIRRKISGYLTPDEDLVTMALELLERTSQ